MTQNYKKNPKIFANLKKGCTFAFALANKAYQTHSQGAPQRPAHSSIG